MVYDPQRDQPRRRAGEDGPSPVDSLLDGGREPRAPEVGTADPEQPVDSVTEPRPPRSCSDRLLHSGGFSSLLSTLVSLLALAWMLKRCKRRRSARRSS